MRTEIGKIQHVKFGFGGYQDAMIGISFTLGSEEGSWGVGDFWGHWAIERSDGAKWTEADRLTYLGKTVMRIKQLLEDAKVSKISDLQGKPVQATFEGNKLVEWRILSEVL